MKLDVSGERLHELNALVTQEFACKDSHPEYIPHITLAYLDPAASAMYDGMLVPFAGKLVQFDNLEFSTPSKQRIQMPLSWRSAKRLELGLKSYFTACPRDAGGHCLPHDQAGHVKTEPPPRRPVFVSTDAAAVAQNVRALDRMDQLANEGKWQELMAYPGIPSPKVQKYKQALLNAQRRRETIAKLPPPESVPLSEPTAADVEDWMWDLENHSYFKAVRRFIQSDMVQTSGLFSQKGKWDAQRVQDVHEPIIEHFLGEGQPVPIGQKPKLLMVIGPPGAGKSTIAAPIAKELLGTFTKANPDDIRERLPEHNGWNATNTHVEACHIGKMIRQRAMAARHNLFYDSTGQQADRMMQMAKDFDREGYEVHVVHVGVPPHVAAYRAAKRFLDNPFSKVDPTAAPSRFVPLNYVYHEVGMNPAKTFAELRNSPHVRSGVSYDNSGSQPVVDDEF